MRATSVSLQQELLKMLAMIPLDMALEIVWSRKLVLGPRTVWADETVLAVHAMHSLFVSGMFVLASKALLAPRKATVKVSVPLVHCLVRPMRCQRACCLDDSSGGAYVSCHLALNGPASQ